MKMLESIMSEVQLLMIFFSFLRGLICFASQDIHCAWQLFWKGSKLRRRAARKLADHSVKRWVGGWCPRNTKGWCPWNTEGQISMLSNCPWWCPRNTEGQLFLFIKGWMRGTHGERRDQAFLHWKCNGNGDGCFDALHVGHRLLIRTIQFTCRDLLIKLQKSNGITTGKDFTRNCRNASHVNVATGDFTWAPKHFVKLLISLQ